MISHTQNDNTKTGKNGLVRAASKTARKFTSFFSADALPHCISVHLDWLSMMMDCFVPEPQPGQESVHLENDIVLRYLKKGTPTFFHTWAVMWGGEHVAMLHTHSRNELIIKPATAKLEFLNHVLYSSTILPCLKDIIQPAIPGIRNITRMDICIDGANHVHTFLNNYVRQKKNRSYPDLKTLGRWDKENRVRMKGKASLDCKRFQRSNGMYENFKIGSSRKSFTLYNKSTEIDQRSRKEYIRDAWIKAGVDVTQDVYRCELRMSSEALKDIKDFDLLKINDPYYLLQIFKTQTKNFFEFVLFEGDGNVTRARVIDLFEFEKLRVPLLEKIPRKVVEGAYKAMMGIHNAYANILKGAYRTKEQIDQALGWIANEVQLYNLDRWYEKKKPAWIELYQPVKYFM